MEPPLHKWPPTGFMDDSSLNYTGTFLMKYLAFDFFDFFLKKITWLQLDTPQKLRNLDTEVVFQGWGIPMRDDTWTLPGIVQRPKGGWLQRIKTNIGASSVAQTYWAMLHICGKSELGRPKGSHLYKSNPSAIIDTPKDSRKIRFILHIQISYKQYYPPGN